jgi:hypothetical protein
MVCHRLSQILIQIGCPVEGSCPEVAWVTEQSRKVNPSMKDGVAFCGNTQLKEDSLR